MSASILLVEDDENDAFFLTRALKKAGIRHAIHRVSDGRQALEYLQGARTFGDRNQFPLPDLVLLDLKLPYVMGLDVLKWIRGQEEFTSTIVAVFSASAHPEDIANSHLHGADAYLVKPSNLNLLDGLAKVIGDAWLTANHTFQRRPKLPGTAGSGAHLSEGQIPEFPLFFATQPENRMKPTL